MPFQFEKGAPYTRDEIADLIQLPAENRRGGDWMTGYSRWREEFFVFANIGVPGRTGHDYKNRWDGPHLIWYGKSHTAIGQPVIDEMISGAAVVHIFWRGADRSPFTYAGLARPLRAVSSTPVEVTWSFDSDTLPNPRGTRERAPAWRRGPPPRIGSRVSQLEEGPADLYLMALAGPTGSIIPNLGDDRIIKVGYSSDPERRLDEMNSGYPPGSILGWTLVRRKPFASANEAYMAESKCLEQLRLGRYWIGGEFARLNTDAFERILLNMFC